MKLEWGNLYREEPTFVKKGLNELRSPPRIIKEFIRGFIREDYRECCGILM